MSYGTEGGGTGMSAGDSGTPISGPRGGRVHWTCVPGDRGSRGVGPEVVWWNLKGCEDGRRVRNTRRMSVPRTGVQISGGKLGIGRVVIRGP